MAASLIKFFKDRCQAVDGNSRTRVLHGHLQSAIGRLSADADLSAFGSKLDRITEQVSEHLQYPLGIDSDRRQRRVDRAFQFNMLRFNQRYDFGDGSLDQGVDAAHLKIVRHHACFHLGKIEKRIDHADEAVAFFSEYPQKLALLLGGRSANAVEQQSSS